MSTFTSFAGNGGHTLGFRSRWAEEEVAAAGAHVGSATTAVVGGGNKNSRRRRRGRKLDRSKRDWSNLPKPAIQLILMGLWPSWRDVFSFAGVCNPWRSVFTDCKGKLFSSMPPLLVDCSSFPAFARFYSVFERRICHRKLLIPRWRDDWFVVGVSHGYCIISSMNEHSKGMPVFLLDPLFPESRIQLPLASHSKLGRGDIWVDKFSRGFMTAPPTSPDCLIVLTERDCIVWYCRPGDREWVCHDLSYEFDAAWCDKYEWMLRHVVVHGRHLYALSRHRKLVVMELLFPRPKVAVVDVEGWPPSDYDMWGRAYNDWDQLVVSDGEILYIAEKTTGGFDDGDWERRKVIVQLDLPARRWVTLDTLGKRTIFLPLEKGTPVTCVGAAEWGGREDCIYYYKYGGGRCLEGWSMKDGIVERHPLPEKFYIWQWWVPSSCSAKVEALI